MASPPLRRIITWLILKNSHPSEVHGSPRLLQCGCWVPNSPNNQEIPIMRVPCCSEKVAFCRVRWNWRCLKITTHTIIDMETSRKQILRNLEELGESAGSTRPDKTNISSPSYDISYVYIYMYIDVHSPRDLPIKSFCNTTFWRNESVNDWSNFLTSWGQPWIETDRFR